MNPETFFTSMLSGAAGSPVSSGAHGDVRVGGPVRFASTGGVDNTSLLIAGVAFLAFVYLVK